MFQKARIRDECVWVWAESLAKDLLEAVVEEIERLYIGKVVKVVHFFLFLSLEAFEPSMETKRPTPLVGLAFHLCWNRRHSSCLQANEATNNANSARQTAIRREWGFASRCTKWRTLAEGRCSKVRLHQSLPLVPEGRECSTKKARAGGDGSARYAVEFTMVVFRPWQGETLVATTWHSDAEGVRLTTGFFHDILIPYNGMQEPSRYDERTSLWLWCVPEQGEAPMDLGETARVKVDEVRFPDDPGDVGEACERSPLHGGTPSGSFAPMVVVGTINQDGLGLTKWWLPAPEPGNIENCDA